MQRIRLEEEFDHLMKQPWVKHGTRLKIKEFKNCLDALPQASSVILTSPEHLSTELFESKGLGTHVSRGERVVKFDNLDQLDTNKVRALIESSFERTLSPNFFQDLKSRLHAVYVTASYEGVAILTKEKGSDVPYLDKFAVSAKVRGQGIKELLWGRIQKENPSLYWRSRVANKINPWYFSHADGHARGAEWIVFWYGISDVAATQNIVKIAQGLPSTLGAPASSEAAKLNVVAAPAQGYRIGLLGARGHTGTNLITLLSQHSHAKLVCATSSTTPGQPVRNVCPAAPEGLNFIDVTAESIEKTSKDFGIDAWFLALHDKAAKPYVDALTRGDNPPILIDLSADHRFDPLWVYGQPEGGNRDKLRGAKRIANPGCYATGMYVTLAPLIKSRLLDGPAHFFGVSGYSGAGTKPSPKNDIKRLADNLMAYTLTNHNHEREVTHQLGHQVNFTPHVGQWFQGITLTGHLKLARPISREELEAKYKEYYGKEVLVKVTKEIPEVKDAAKKHHLTIGGLELDGSGSRVVTVTTLDNLLKGAATQAIQNLNLALRLENEYEGLGKEL
jgi:N-acetyl-gamma-glutamyl-phosphate reductase/acetylglutamate kinase